MAGTWAPAPCCSCRWPTSWPGSSRWAASTAGSGSGTRGPQRLLPDLGSFRPTFILRSAGVRKGLQQRQAEGVSDARADLRPRGQGRHRYSEALDRPASALAARRHVLFDKLVSPSCGPRSAGKPITRRPAAPRSASGSGISSAARASHPRGVRTDGDHGRGDRQPPGPVKIGTVRLPLPGVASGSPRTARS